MSASLGEVAGRLMQRLAGAWTKRRVPAGPDRGALVELWDGSFHLALSADGTRVAVTLPGDATPSAWIAGALVTDDELAQIERLVAEGRARPTARTLVPGARYRVRADMQALRAGMQVRFVEFDDVDNHFGRLVLADASGARVYVEGDFSSASSPVARVHTYLAPDE